jgi:hypothetical protein
VTDENPPNCGYPHGDCVLGDLIAAAEQARDDFMTGTHEMLGELLEAHQITPEPCLGGPCVANALLAIGARLSAAEKARDERAGVAQSWRNQYDGMKAEVERLGSLLTAAEQARDAAYAELRKQADRILALEHMIENRSTE